MAHAFCYAQCRSPPLLDSTDTKALDVGRSLAALVLVLLFETQLFIHDQANLESELFVD
jgi:hypothetical protein